MAAGAAFLSCMQAFSGGIPVDNEIPLVWSPIITLSGGPAWTAPGQNVYLYPYLPFNQVAYFVHNSSTSTIAAGEIFFGLQRMISPWAIGELGLGVAGATDADVTGTVTLNGVPNFSYYRYKIDHGRLELKGRIIGNSFGRVQPYASASIGAGMNQSHDYRATTINPLIYPAPWFQTKTVLSLPYTFGLGVQTKLTRQWIVGIGYEFADLGRSYLGGDAYTHISGPYMSHYYTNELLFSISYAC